MKIKPPFPNFTHLEKTVILRPGNAFSKNEIKSRLGQMDIQYDPSLAKEYLAYLYNNALKHEKNQIKIFDKLLKDTLYYDKISYMNKREKINEPPLKINNSNKVTIISVTSHNSGRPNNTETPLKTNNPDTVPKIVETIKPKDPKPVSTEQNIISNTKKEESKD